MPRQRAGLELRRDFGAPVSRCPESAASLVLLFLEADERGGGGRRLVTGEKPEAGGQQGARLLVQRDEALNVRGMVGVAVEDGEREGNKREHGEHGQEPRCEPEAEPERRLSREKRHVTISLSHLAWLVGHCYDTTRRRNVTVDEQQWLAERFDEHRSHLRAVAYRMLGSLSEADDAVQEAWVRLSRTDASAVENLGGWLTTVVGRVSLNMLRSRKGRREEPLGVHLPDPILDRADGMSPEHEALLADSVGLALLVVL